MPYTLNLYSAAYQLYFNKNEKKNPPKQVRVFEELLVLLKNKQQQQ